jgi:hydrogenase maturation protease
VVDGSQRYDAVPGEGPAPRIAVLGLGNVLMGDDALGPTVVRRLAARHTFASDVSVMDVGTPGLDLTPFVSGLETLILVDTVKSGGPPGTLRTYRRDDILRNPPPQRVSPHDPGLKETLLTLEFAGLAPREVFLVGLVPGDTSMHAALTAAVRDGLAAVEAEVLRELERLGAPAVARPEPLAPDLWWETAG